MENTDSRSKLFELDNQSIKRHLQEIASFIEFCSLESAKEQLLEILNAAMYSEFFDEIGANRRGDVIYFYRLLQNLIEAIHWIAVPLFEKFQYPVPLGLEIEMPECPYCSSKIDLKYD